MTPWTDELGGPWRLKYTYYTNTEHNVVGLDENNLYLSIHFLSNLVNDDHISIIYVWKICVSLNNSLWVHLQRSQLQNNSCVIEIFTSPDTLLRWMWACVVRKRYNPCVIYKDTVSVASKSAHQRSGGNENATRFADRESICKTRLRPRSTDISFETYKS